MDNRRLERWRRTFALGIGIVLSIAEVYGKSPRTGSARGWGTAVWGKDLTKGFKAVSVRSSHGLALNTDGGIVGWGTNFYGQSLSPSPNSGFTAVSAGGIFSLGLKTNGSIVAWGYNYNHQCEIPTPNEGFIAISAGDNHSLGLKSDGSIVTWGLNPCPPCFLPSPNTGFTAISAGASYSLALRADGSIAAWGDNRNSQCNVPEPNASFAAISAGYNHSLGLKADGRVVAWGNNDFRQCDVPEPNSGFIKVIAGTYNSFGLKANGSAIAWGQCVSGESDFPLPNEGFLDIGIGDRFGAALREDGSISPLGNVAIFYDYGENNGPLRNFGFTSISTAQENGIGRRADGSLDLLCGLDAYGNYSLPHPNTGFLAVATGSDFTFGLKYDGSILLWGLSHSGTLLVPQPNSGFVNVASGSALGIGFRSNGSLTTWGENLGAQLEVPIPNEAFVSTAAGPNFVLGLKENGTIVGWGYSRDGLTTVPEPNRDFVKVVTGGTHALALRTDGSVLAWGKNDLGQCNVPLPNANFMDIAAGDSHSVGLKNTGNVVAWGNQGDFRCSLPSPNAGFISIAAAGAKSFGLVDSGPCEYLLDPPSNHIDSFGDTKTFDVFTSSGCAWVASCAEAWITVTTGTFVESGMVTYTVASNSLPFSRTAEIEVEGTTHTVYQDPNCTYSLLDSQVSILRAGGDGRFVVCAASDQCHWKAHTEQPWITIMSGEGTGAGTVEYQVSENPDPFPRNGSIDVEGLEFRIWQQPGCAYSIKSTEESFTASGGQGGISLITDTSCEWTASATEAWIAIPSPKGLGNAIVLFDAAQNPGPAPRTGTINVQGLPFTINQKAPCRFDVSPAQVSFDSEGGTSTVQVIATCPFKPISGQDWLTIADYGTSSITFLVTANTVASPRMGTISIGDKTVAIAQEGKCEYALNPSNASYSYAGGAGGFSLTTGSDCRWNAASEDGWILITNLPDTGTTTVTYQVAANPLAATRIGTISVADKQHTITQTGIGPDLTGSWDTAKLTCRMNHGVRTCTLNTNLIIRNVGNQDAGPFKVSYYLSSDNRASNDDTRLTSYNVTRLEAFQMISRGSLLRIPSSVNPSGKFLLAVLDENNSIPDANPQNNIVLAIVH